jgi:hypothetical protein
MKYAAAAHVEANAAKHFPAATTLRLFDGGYYRVIIHLNGQTYEVHTATQWEELRPRLRRQK